MKTLSIIFLVIIIFTILNMACEKRSDPFSTLNKAPVISTFSFAKDSLKFTRENPFKITLKYKDYENQQLTATFKFLSGHGDIFHINFKEKNKQDNVIIFDAPWEFNDLLNFIPDTTGKIEIELELSDKVKISTKTAGAFFFDNLSPVANFSYKLLSIVAPYELEVDASKSYDPDEGEIKWYYWWFDDGTPVIKTGSNTYQHKYQHSGTYTIRLKVEDNDGGVDSTEQAITTDNQPPLAILQVDPLAGEAPLTIHYTATNSIDPDGDIVSYRVDFDDGASSLDSVGSHTYNIDNNYLVKLKVQDNLGQNDTTSVSVKVATSPVAVLKITPIEGPFPLDCLIDGTGSYDPQGGKLEHDIYIDGSLKYDNIDSIGYTFDTPKNYLVRLLVTSNRNGLTDEAQQIVAVKNLNPDADFIWEPNTPQHTVDVTYTSTSTDRNLTDEITYYKWTFPRGITLEGDTKSIVTQEFDGGIEPYTVKLEVWDKFNGYDSITKIIPKGN